MTLTPTKLTAALAAFEQQLQQALPTPDTLPDRLHHAMRYATLGQAKRLRPLWVYATALSFGAPLAAAHPAAIAVELIHSYSLVHDDLPAMDNDDWRRGQPTCHKAYDEATAILVGDALLTLAFDVLSQPTGEDSHTQLRLIQLLAQAAGSRGMVGGQQLDMQYEGTEVSAAAVETMLSLKTGRLIRASILMGATLAKADATALAQLTQFADLVGLAFQLKDDILDLTGDPAVLGKATQKDLSRQKASAIDPESLARSEQTLQRITTQALQCLTAFDHDTSALQEMVHFTVQRTR